jgi:hypothetical protein
VPIAKPPAAPNDCIENDCATYIHLSRLFQFQGRLEAVNTLGIVVAIDDDTPRISDLSRKDLLPIAVEGVSARASREQRLFSCASGEDDASVKEGDCVLLRGFIVWFETKTGLPRLCKEGSDRSRAGTCSIWKREDDYFADGDPSVGMYERQEMEGLRRWWTKDKRYR